MRVVFHGFISFILLDVKIFRYNLSIHMYCILSNIICQQSGLRVNGTKTGQVGTPPGLETLLRFVKVNNNKLPAVGINFPSQAAIKSLINVSM